ncbi:hypothetical protein L483_15735 [Pseudomonas putida H8234]|nr:hypothetical protein L483_15735 [Pseudomonas putida H8234]
MSLTTRMSLMFMIAVTAVLCTIQIERAAFHESVPSPSH